MCKVSVIIPTLNAGENIVSLLKSLKEQKGIKFKILIIDSGSNDKTVQYSRKYACLLKNINKKDFNHGKTRQIGVDICKQSEFLIFLTQDVILKDEYCLRNIIGCFHETNIGSVYGQQLPHRNANPIATHARLFNYPSKSCTKSMADIEKLGIKTVFISNSFAAYRRKALYEVGGFPNDVILSEDTYVAAKMILKGWKIGYCADAKVYHSHDYTILQEVKRYFDIGVFHAKEPWIREKFGGAEGEGIHFVLSEIQYVLKYSPFHIFNLITRDILKLFAYKLGLMEKIIPIRIKKILSMNRFYWK